MLCRVSEFSVLRVESRNEDYEADELTSSGIRRSIGLRLADEGSRLSRSVKTKSGATRAKARPRSVTFRPAGEEIKNFVVTNAMLSRPQETAKEAVNKYGVGVINERALGKVVDHSIALR